MKNKILNYTKEFFEKLEVDIISIEIINEESNFYFIKIESDDSALLIGQHGKTIESIQKILSICINNLFKEDEHLSIKLEINNYFKSYEDKLFARVDRSITSLLNNGGEYDFGAISSYDRKRVHSYVAKNHSKIITKSRGEGKNRRLFLMINKNKTIKKVTNKLTIDIDGDDI